VCAGARFDLSGLAGKRKGETGRKSEGEGNQRQVGQGKYEMTLIT